MAGPDLKDTDKPVPYELHVDEELLSITKQELSLARYSEEQTELETMTGIKVPKWK